MNTLTVTVTPPTMITKNLIIFTRTPLHVGAGASVGAIDQPIQRERHTGLPIIPASSLKGSLSDQWTNAVMENGKEVPLVDDEGNSVRVKTKILDGKVQIVAASDGAWLFGSDNTDAAFAGAIIFSEARVLAFPIRSAKGSFAWITCPLMLQRFARDGGMPTIRANGTTDGTLEDYLPMRPIKDSEAIFDGPDLDLGEKVVLEDYCFKMAGESLPPKLAGALAGLLPGDAILPDIAQRLVILSNGMMSHFATTACEVAQHVSISDQTGTANDGGLFNQENVPSETLFYSVVRFMAGRGEHFKARTADEAGNVFKAKLEDVRTFQFGGDASTGHGFCTVKLS